MRASILEMPGRQVYVYQSLQAPQKTYELGRLVHSGVGSEAWHHTNDKRDEGSNDAVQFRYKC